MRLVQLEKGQRIDVFLIDDINDNNRLITSHN